MRQSYLLRKSCACHFQKWPKSSILEEKINLLALAFFLPCSQNLFDFQLLIQYYLQFQGQTRRIDLIIVFGITAFFSIFAYIWLLIILKWSSPDEVELWESILTFLFFPILTVIAFCGDKGWLDFLKCQRSGSGSGSAGMSDKQRQIELGSFQPGESTYRTNFLCFSSMFLLWTRLEHFWPPSQIVSCFCSFLQSTMLHQWNLYACCV